VFPKFLYNITAFSLVYPRNVGNTMQPSQFGIPLSQLSFSLSLYHICCSTIHLPYNLTFICKVQWAELGMLVGPYLENIFVS
jgi:hypothetical protein